MVSRSWQGEGEKRQQLRSCVGSTSAHCAERQGTTEAGGRSKTHAWKMKTAKMKYRDVKYRDFDALAHEQRVRGDDDRLAINHVTKKKLKATKANTGEIVFDPAGHK